MGDELSVKGRLDVLSRCTASHLAQFVSHIWVTDSSRVWLSAFYHVPFIQVDVRVNQNPGSWNVRHYPDMAKFTRNSILQCRRLLENTLEASARAKCLSCRNIRAPFSECYPQSTQPAVDSIHVIKHRYVQQRKESLLTTRWKSHTFTHLYTKHCVWIHFFYFHHRVQLSFVIWVRDFVQGILRLVDSHCALCTFGKAHHPNTGSPNTPRTLTMTHRWDHFQKVHTSSLFLIMNCVRFGITSLT